MEFLFTNQIASIEAIIFFACVAIIAAIFGYDFYLYLRQMWQAFFPRRVNLWAETVSPDLSAAIATPTVSEILANTPDTPQTPISTEEIIVDNPILYHLL
jgi:hypothetical protein